MLTAALLSLFAAPLPQDPAPAPPKEAPPVEVPTAQSISTWDAFADAAVTAFGTEGALQARFLRKYRPERDAELPADWLIDNLRLAREARGGHPWSQNQSDELFLNAVLPYAVLDETRENWRGAMRARVLPIVKDAKTATEAAQAINRELFNLVGVHYNTGRKRPNACASESIAQGRATCTGLTILFVEACRSVGIPARAAGVRLWHDDRGNHTWPEVWDGERWRFTGADEYDAKGLDRGWFQADASRAQADDRDHAIWAGTWETGKGTFPLAWAPKDDSVAAVNVTQRYLADEAKVQDALAQLGAADKALGEEASQRLVMELWKTRKKALAAELAAEAEAKAYRVGDHVLRVKERVFGDEPKGGHSLWISMHGGGGAPASVNDGQWENQIKLYQPAEGIYVAPRAPTDTWNLWHQGHIDALFDRMIAAYVTLRGVNPDRVFLMGYSAGGDGVYQLSPRMADRFAAAAMMAGHPNETKPDGLRNLPFALFMGGKDGAYDRNKIAAQWKIDLAALRDSDPGGYDHEVTIYPDKAHWMDREDAAALPWMAERTRRTWPDRIVWLQDDVTHDRFYWLAVEPGTAVARARVEASVEGQTIRIQTDDVKALTLHLHDRWIDLDQDLRVEWNGAEVFKGKPMRSRAAIEASLDTRADPGAAATAILKVGVD